MSQFYSDPEREAETYSLPDCEVFYAEKGELEPSDDGEESEAGWYYWFCFPGCLPDSMPFGPYESEREAIEACREEWTSW